jgi:hypothetical protein
MEHPGLSRSLVGYPPIFSLPNLADGGKPAQIMGRADKASAVAHANVTQLMQLAVGEELTLLKVSRGMIS